MHVKQLDTSSAFQMIPRKATVYSRRKSFTSLLRREQRVGPHKKESPPAVVEVTGQ